MRTARFVGGLAACLVLVAGTVAQAADVFNMGGTRDPVTGTWTGLASIEFVPVGNPGNAADTRYVKSGYGSVAYAYNIGKYEVTAGQYTAFLNAVAATDTYGLYVLSMDTSVYSYGCNIKQSGSSGSYTYSVPSDWANRPVTAVSLADAMRFTNWLHNGQPTGPQGLSTTEDGAYYLNGATTAAQIQAVTRKAGWKWAVTSEDEWYKAAYFDPNKAGGPGYWNYSTGTDSVPSNVLSSTGTNNVNFYAGGYTIGSPYYRTDVGAFAGSDSPYGTFDQGGNVWEWNEAIVTESTRALRGGSFIIGYEAYIEASYRDYSDPTFKYNNGGFRISEVPEPATLSLLALGGLAILRRRRALKR